MSRFECMKILLRWFPQDIIYHYNIIDLVEKDGFVYVNIRKGVCGLKKAAHIYFHSLVKILNPNGCYPIHSNPGILCHETLQQNSCFVWIIWN